MGFKGWSNYYLVKIELDAEAVINLVYNSTQTNTSLNALGAKCWELIKGIPHTKLYHSNKEANGCLDAHASRGCLSLDLTLLLEPLGEVAMFIYLSEHSHLISTKNFIYHLKSYFIIYNILFYNTPNIPTFIFLFNSLK